MSTPAGAIAEAERLIGSIWSEFHLFTLAEVQATLPAEAPSPEEEDREKIIALFTSREHAFRAGISFSGDSFAVHQYETTRGVDLVYGRTGDAVSGCGACVARIRQATGENLYVALCYKFPSLSANAVSKLVDFAREHLGAEYAKDDGPIDKPSAVA